MKFNKFSAILCVVAILGTLLVSSLVREALAKQEKTRLENILVPVIAKAVEALPDPKPTLHFLVPMEKAFVVVLFWKQTPEVSIKNDVRGEVILAIQHELATDPASWGRSVSVIFSDEVVKQGWK